VQDVRTYERTNVRLYLFLFESRVDVGYVSGCGRISFCRDLPRRLHVNVNTSPAVQTRDLPPPYFLPKLPMSFVRFVRPVVFVVFLPRRIVMCFS
jgi:hypothetical protein